MFIFVEVSIDVPLNFYDASDYNPIRLLSMRYCMILIQDLHNIKPSILLLTQMSIQQLLHFDLNSVNVKDTNYLMLLIFSGLGRILVGT
jgi:hypothetical protein